MGISLSQRGKSPSRFTGPVIQPRLPYHSPGARQGCLESIGACLAEVKESLHFSLRLRVKVIPECFLGPMPLRVKVWHTRMVKPNGTRA